jgi:tRNA (mo5U34)-methyltransferase
MSLPRTSPSTGLTPAAIQQRVDELGDWFQNMDLGGVKTAPRHFLGDYPTVKWQRFAPAIPADLRGQTVLDIGCNAGFYSLEMKRRGAARVLGVDSDEKYLAQARFAAETLGHEIEFRQLSVYDVAQLGEKFDVVIFMGVLYHLRHPLLALDLIREHVTKDLLVFQSLQRGYQEEPRPLPDDEPFNVAMPFERNVSHVPSMFERPDYPVMYFIEKRYSNDPTNWWIPNRACVEAMLRSAGFTILDHPEEEVYICRLNPEVTTP